MKCVVCKKGETQRGEATVTFTQDGTVVVFKDVPADLCTNCGEEYVDEKTSGRLLKAAQEAARAGVQVEIREYVAA